MASLTFLYLLRQWADTALFRHRSKVLFELCERQKYLAFPMNASAALTPTLRGRMSAALVIELDSTEKRADDGVRRPPNEAACHGSW